MTRTQDGVYAWAERVVDHRDLIAPSAGSHAALPPVLPPPGFESRQPKWKEGVVAFELPDTTHLPSGGIGGTFTIAVHLIPGQPNPLTLTMGAGVVVTLMTYPDGYRLGTVWPVAHIHRDPWRDWMSGVDAMSHAFTNRADPWVIAQRAWATRRWYDFEANAPAGVSLKVPTDREGALRSLTLGLMSSEGIPAASNFSNPDITALQQAGFWLLDPRQQGWLIGGAAPLGTAVDDGNGGLGDGARLLSMYESGWRTEAYQHWMGTQPPNAASLHARNFMRVTQEWEDTLAQACAVLSARTQDTTVKHLSDRVGETASMCLLLDLTPFNVGVMVGDGTFSLDALRTLVALRANADEFVH